MIIISSTCFETFPTIGSFSTLEKRKSYCSFLIKKKRIGLSGNPKLTVFPSRPDIKCVIFRMPTLVFRAWATC